jgi:SHS2 domain-containing protein
MVGQRGLWPLDPPYGKEVRQWRPHNYGKAMYEVFSHTADAGLRVTAANPNDLLADAGRGLCSLIVADVATVRPVEQRHFRIEGTNLAYLLIDWLNELLFAFESQRLLLSQFEVSVDASGLTATAMGETVDERRHALAHEVKAVTYHGLLVEQRDGSWVAEVILDI